METMFAGDGEMPKKLKGDKALKKLFGKVNLIGTTRSGSDVTPWWHTRMAATLQLMRPRVLQGATFPHSLPAFSASDSSQALQEALMFTSLPLLQK